MAGSVLIVDDRPTVRGFARIGKPIKRPELQAVVKRFPGLAP